MGKIDLSHSEISQAAQNESCLTTREKIRSGSVSATMCFCFTADKYEKAQWHECTDLYIYSSIFFNLLRTLYMAVNHFHKLYCFSECWHCIPFISTFSEPKLITFNHALAIHNPSEWINMFFLQGNAVESSKWVYYGNRTLTKMNADEMFSPALD